MRFLLSSSTFQAVFMTSPSECPAVALDFVDPNQVINLPAGRSFFQFLLSSRPYHRPPRWLDPLNACYLSLCPSSPLPSLFSSSIRYPPLLPWAGAWCRCCHSSCPTSVLLWLHAASSSGAVDLAGVILTQEAAERFVFLCCCSDLFNLLLCPFSIPTLSSFQNQSSCLLYTRYTCKGLCPFLKHQVISVFTIYLLSLQITFFFP